MRSLLLCAILGTSDGSLRKWLCCGHDAVSQVADQKRPSSDTRETSLELVVNPVQQKDDRQHTDEVLKELLGMNDATLSALRAEKVI